MQMTETKIPKNKHKHVGILIVIGTTKYHVHFVFMIPKNISAILLHTIHREFFIELATTNRLFINECKYSTLT